MSVPPVSDLAASLAEDRWLRALARRLVADPDAAEDLAQETWVRALASGGAARSPRAWLAGVLRNLRRDTARGQGRRERREREVGGSRDEAPGPDDLVSEIELRGRLSDALLALEEPYRSTIVRRFFREESLSAIARREGVAVSTVHERLERGLARLRARMDEAHGGRREAWAVGLAALARPFPTKAILEAAIMAGAGKVAASVVVAGGVLAWWWWPHEEPQRRAPQAAEVLQEPPASREPALVAPTEEATSRSETGTSTPAPVPAATAALVPGRLLDPEGRALSGLEVSWMDAGAPGVVTDAAGGFLLAPVPEGRRLAVRTAGFTTLVHGARPRTGDERVVVAAPAADFAGRVIDATGEPIAKARLALRLEARLFAAAGIEPLGLWDDVPGWRTTSDENGLFALPDLAGGPGVRLEVEATGFQPRRLELSPRGDPALEVALEAVGGPSDVRGVVLGPDGRPFEGAQVSLGVLVVRTAYDGSFTLPRESQRSFEQDESGVWRPRNGWLTALAPGFLPARMPIADLPEEPVVLTLGPAPLTIAGRVVDAEGAPLPDLVVWASDLTRFGSEEVSLASTESFQRDSYVERLLCPDAAATAHTGSEGRFEFGCLMARSYRLRVVDPATQATSGPWTVEAGTRGLELVFDGDRSVTRVAGTIRSFTGRPLEGVTLVASIDPLADEEGPDVEPLTAVSDAEGRFAFEALAVEGTLLHLTHDRILFRWVDLDDQPDPQHLDLVEALQCEVQVEPGRDPDLADTVGFLDAAGEELEVMTVVSSDGTLMASIATWGTLTEGRSEVLRVPESAVTVVYRRGAEEVLRRPVTLDPDRRTTIHP